MARAVENRKPPHVGADRERPCVLRRAVCTDIRHFPARVVVTPSWRSGSARSGPPPRPGTISCGSSAGAARGSACTRRSRRWAFERREPTRCGTSTPTVIPCSTGRVYRHAVIDNFPRRIVAWRVADTCAPVNSVACFSMPVEAQRPQNTTPVVLADAGVENVNAQVDDLISTGVLRRVLAFTELTFSIACFRIRRFADRRLTTVVTLSSE